MKKYLFIFLIAFLYSGASAPVNAHFLYLDVTGEQTASTGEQIGAGVYLHATQNDSMIPFGEIP
ncbi:MAG: hypothetical protein PVG39_09570 [Desulfobacteraceae bacterium]|jgi:hypothetical protein